MPKYEDAYTVIENAVEDLNLKVIVSLFSGGHDSLLSTYVASKHPLFKGCIYANTLTGAKETRQYIHDTCSHFSWDLKEFKPNLMTYEMILIKYGYPSPATHQMMYRHLKDRSFDDGISAYAKEYDVKRGEVGVVTGVRRW